MGPCQRGVAERLDKWTVGWGDVSVCPALGLPPRTRFLGAHTLEVSGVQLRMSLNSKYNPGGPGRWGTGHANSRALSLWVGCQRETQPRAKPLKFLPIPSFSWVLELGSPVGPRGEQVSQVNIMCVYHAHCVDGPLSPYCAQGLPVPGAGGRLPPFKGRDVTHMPAVHH